MNCPHCGKENAQGVDHALKLCVSSETGDAQSLLDMFKAMADELGLVAPHNGPANVYERVMSPSVLDRAWKAWQASTRAEAETGETPSDRDKEDLRVLRELCHRFNPDLSDRLTDSASLRPPQPSPTSEPDWRIAGYEFLKRWTRDELDDDLDARLPEGWIADHSDEFDKIVRLASRDHGGRA